MTPRERRRLVVSLSISFILAFFLTIFLWNGFLGLLQSRSLDIVYQTYRGTVGVDDLLRAARNVVIVGIDDAAIQALGRFGEWPRSHYAQVIDELNRGYARVIAFDVGFVEANAHDEVVAAALQRYLTVDPEAFARQGIPLRRRAVILPVVGRPEQAPGRRERTMLRYDDKLENLDVYRRAVIPSGRSTPLEGHVNIVPDEEDGSVRSTPLIIQIGNDEPLPALGLAAAMAYNGATGAGATREPGRTGVRALNRFVPTDPSYRMMISYVGPPSRLARPDDHTFKVVSFVDVMEGRVDPSVFNDKLVFIGLMDATGFADDYQVPTSGGVGKMRGVEIHANVFSTLISSHVFVEQDFPISAGTIWLLCILTGLVAFRFSIVASAVFALAASSVYVLGAMTYASTVYDPDGVGIPNMLYPPLSIIATFMAVTVYRVVFEEGETRATRNAMGKYLSPAILEEVLREPEKLRLGGRKEVMSVLFTDIRGFTTISEQYEPERLIRILNTYLTAMTNIVHQWQGVLDKYMGDAIMAWWGAPVEQPDHAYRACMTGLQMRTKLAELQEDWVREGLPRLEMGVGINTGSMVYGNTGSEERFDFTVLGDSVNLASRLEGANKEYGSNVIISQSTYDDVKDRHFVVRFLDVIEVKGKTEPVGIYELMGVEGRVAPGLLELIEHWNTAIELYRSRDFALAERAFQRVLDVAPLDGPANVYLQRCGALRENPPSPDWDGVFVMTHK